MGNIIRSIVYSLEKTPIYVFICMVSIIQLIICLQGFDVCDEGWYLSYYQQIFEAPKTVEYNFLFWLTGIVGGLLYKLLPNGGVLSFRILTILCYALCYYFSYKILKTHIRKSLLVLGLTMAVFVSDFGFLAFYYNHFSSLLFIIASFYLLKGMDEYKQKYFFISGFIITLNIFSRLPNFVLLVIGLIIPLQFFFRKEKEVYQKGSLFFVLGCCTSLVTVFVTMYQLQHIEILKDSILSMVNKGEHGDSNHNISKLAIVYFENYKMIFKRLLLFLPLIITPVLIQKKTKQKVVGCLTGTIYLVYSYFIFQNQNIYNLYALAILGTVAMFLSPNQSKKNIAMVSFVMMHFLPLGSDGGIGNVGYVCLWIGLPLFLNFCYNFSINIKSSLISNQNRLRVLIIPLVISYFTVKAIHIFNESYFDKGSRLEKTFRINHSLANVFTTEKRSNIINDLLDELPNHVRAGDYLLAYDNIPMLNYLTNTRPYMYISWVWVYDSITFNKKLQKAQKEINVLPVVVLQKFQTIFSFSPPTENYMDENKTENYIYKRGRTKSMNVFLKENNYIKTWSNQYFDILKPQ